MQGACSSATEALLARQDGCIHAGAGQLLQGFADAESQPAHLDTYAPVWRACRRILLQLTMIKVCRRLAGVLPLLRLTKIRICCKAPMFST